MSKSKLLRMDNVGIVVKDLQGTIGFFKELGLELEGEMSVEGKWVDRIVGLKGVRNDIAMMRTPDGHSRLELIKFRNPPVTSTALNEPVNSFGIRRMMFTVKNIEEVIARLQKKGASLIGEIVQYENTYRLCYLRGPEGIMVGLAEEIDDKTASDPGNSEKSALLRMDNVLIVVDDLEAASAFFLELGLEQEWETNVEGPSVDKLIGLNGVRATLAMMRTADGHGRIELDKFLTPGAVRLVREDAPVNTLGIRRIMFAIEDIDDTVARLRARGAELVGEVVQFEDMYRLCYMRGPEGIIIALAEQLGSKTATDILNATQKK